MKKNEGNNIFKYATKELNEYAFICWCVNWINYPNNKLYNLGKEMLKEIIFPNVEDNELYPNYSKNEIMEKYNIFSSEIKDNINEEIKATQQELNELDKIYNSKNNEVNLIKKELKQQIEELKTKVNLDKIENLKITKQFKHMNIVITINKEFVVIIEDKIDGITDKQLERYVRVLNETIKENNTTELELLELDGKKFNSSKIIPVYMKTGRITFNEKLITFRRINGKVIRNVLEKYKNENDIINDFYQCLNDKLIMRKKRMKKIICVGNSAGYNIVRRLISLGIPDKNIIYVATNLG